MNYTKYIKKNRTFLLTTFSFFIVLEVISFLYVNSLTDAAINFLNVKNAKRFEQQIQFGQNHLTSNSQIFYDRDINTPRMKEIMKEASVAQENGDNTKLATLRAELHSMFLSEYDYMKKNSVRQLHFHLPNAVSFLRFHRPSKFGDSLLNVRNALRYVDESKKPMHVFEEGRIFNGFRNIYPIFEDREFVGTVEVSYSFTAMQKVMQKVDSAALLFLIDSDVVQETVLSEEQKNYKQSEFFGLSYDSKTFKDQEVLSVEQIRYINEHIHEEVTLKLKKKEKFAVRYQDDKVFNGRHISIDFLPILNIDKEIVAYIVQYEDDSIIDEILGRHITLLIAFSILSFFISISVGFLLKRAKKEVEQVKKIAAYDALTKIYNRYGLKHAVLDSIGDYREYEKDISVIFFDIDHFKKVNDTHGHDAGDDVLENLAALLSSHIRGDDIFARWGGEEFIIVVPQTPLNAATKLAEKLRLIVEEYDFVTPQHITCSFGVAQLLEGEDEIKLLKRVDELLYEAKDSGRNCVKS